MESVYDNADLPDRLRPMLVKELRQGLRRGLFLIPFITIHVLAVAAMYVEFHTDDEISYDRYTGVLQVLLFFDQSPFWWVAGGVCMVLMPLGALSLMQAELDEGNYELLQMSGLSRWRIVLGKFFSMWSICMLTFSSLLPYMIVRYFVGGMDVWRNVAMTLTVVVLSAIICAGAIASSSYKKIASRAMMLVLFVFSACVSGAISLGLSAMVSGGCGIFYHLNVVAFTFCYLTFGLVMARSRIRLVVHHYEVKPSWMLTGLLVFTPMVVGMATALTGGWMGCFGLAAMGIVAKFSDVSPKAPAWLAAGKTNIPQQPLEFATQGIEAGEGTGAEVMADPFSSMPCEEKHVRARLLTPELPPSVELETKVEVLRPMVTRVTAAPKVFPKVEPSEHEGWR